MYPSVKNVVPAENYIISIDFDNGESGILDMKPCLDFGIFQRLKDHNAFKRVRVSFDTIEWSSGIDIDPEFVYNNTQRSNAHQGALVGAKEPRRYASRHVFQDEEIS